MLAAAVYEGVRIKTVRGKVVTAFTIDMQKIESHVVGGKLGSGCGIGRMQGDVVSAVDAERRRNAKRAGIHWQRIGHGNGFVHDADPVVTLIFTIEFF
jgi:hypothetical protein